MKRYLLLLIVLLLPIFVDAKEYCTVVTGNGKDIGSEIACGNEHFYLIKNEQDNIKLISKYNLYVGYIFDKKSLDIDHTYIKYECINDSCSFNPEYYFEDEAVSSIEQWQSKIKAKFGLDNIIDSSSYLSYVSSGNYALYSEVGGQKYIEGDKTYLKYTYKLYPYTTITNSVSGYSLQNPLALGVNGEKGNANYPIYATIPLFGDYTDDIDMPISYFIKSFENYKNGFINFEFKDDSYISGILNSYKNSLIGNGFEINDVDLINMKDLDDLVYSVSGKKLPLEEWFNNSINNDYIVEDESIYYNLGDLKQYLSDDYSWVWNTSYWMKTIANTSLELTDKAYRFNVYFVSTSGDICFAGSSCWSGIPRAGIRPIVTISKDNIKYKIKIETDGKGTIEVVDSAYGGEVISFRVSTKKGYKLNSLTIITDVGEKVIFNEEDIQNNNDGTISISTNKFTMPYENITIQARWTSTITNPVTKTSLGIIIFTSLTILGIYLYSKKFVKEYN